MKQIGDHGKETPALFRGPIGLLMPVACDMATKFPYISTNSVYQELGFLRWSRIRLPIQEGLYYVHKWASMVWSCTIAYVFFGLFYTEKRNLSRILYPGTDDRQVTWRKSDRQVTSTCPCFPGVLFIHTPITWVPLTRLKCYIGFMAAWLYIEPTHVSTNDMTWVNRERTQSIAITLQSHPCKQPTVWSRRDLAIPTKLWHVNFPLACIGWCIFVQTISQ